MTFWHWYGIMQCKNNYDRGGYVMIYTGNEMLVKEFKKMLIDKGIKQQFIADKLGISKQSLNLRLNKKHITFDDMMMLLECIGYKLDFDFVPVGQSEK